MATSALSAGRGPLGRIFNFTCRRIVPRTYATEATTVTGSTTITTTEGFKAPKITRSKKSRAPSVPKPHGPRPFKVSDYIGRRKHILPHPKPVSKLKRIKVYPAAARHCPVNALRKFQEKETEILDPLGERRKYFDKTSRSSFQPGDILQVRFKDRNVEPFAGVLINIRRRGVDTGFLLRGNMTNLGVEMWYKAYSPVIESVQLLQKAAKRARRAKLYYMRQPKHDFKEISRLAGKYNESLKVLRHLRRDLEDASAASKGKGSGKK